MSESAWARAAMAAIAAELEHPERDRASAVTIASVLRAAIAAADRESARRKDSILDASLATLMNARDESLCDLRIVARALYPDDANSASLTAEELAQQATRLHELCAHERAENAKLRARNIALESDLAHRNQRIAMAEYDANKLREWNAKLYDSLNRAHRERDDARRDLDWLRERERPSAPDALSPITQSAPLKVGDRVRLRDAVVEDIIGPSIIIVAIACENDAPTVRCMTVGTIAGRVTP